MTGQRKAVLGFRGQQTGQANRKEETNGVEALSPLHTLHCPIWRHLQIQRQNYEEYQDGDHRALNPMWRSLSAPGNVCDYTGCRFHSWGPQMSFSFTNQRRGLPRFNWRPHWDSGKKTEWMTDQTAEGRVLVLTCVQPLTSPWVLWWLLCFL